MHHELRDELSLSLCVLNKELVGGMNVKFP
jgi:hypothetical protein